MPAALQNIAARTLRVVLICALALSVVLPVGCGGTASSSASSSTLASIAQSELDGYAAGSDGEKYWRWIGFTYRVAWCACFASYCADQAGLYPDYAPKNAAVRGWINFYQENPQAGSLESGDTYKPQAGDFIVWEREDDPDARMNSHIGVVVEYDATTNQVTTIEGNSSRAVNKRTYDANTGVTYYIHPAGSGSASSTSGLAGCSTSSSSTLTAGTTIAIPVGLGSVHTYMGWQTITNTSSAQYRLRAQAGENYDSEGFAKIGDRYVVACTTTFGDVGDYVDFYQADGTVINAIIGDIKSQTYEAWDHNPANEWGHDNGQCIIEFVVDKNTWYNTGHANPGTSSCHPEWNQTLTKAVNGGSYFDGAATTTSGFSLSGCSFLGNSSTDATAAKAKLNLTEDYRASFQHGNLAASAVSYIMLHDTEMDATPQQTVDSWDNSGAGIAAHFVVGTDGSIIQCVPLSKIAHHAGFGDTGHNDSFGVSDDSADDKEGTTSIGASYADYGMNSHSIGIEMVHVGGQSTYTQAQLEALDNLIAYIDASLGTTPEIIDHKMWRTTNSDTSAEFASYLTHYRNSRTHDGQ